MADLPKNALARSPMLSVVGGLDGLRALAVSMVIVYHYGVSAVPGGYGVTLFFNLSGFLITRLLLREHRETGSISFKRFYIRRALRIFPAFYGYWILIVLALAVTGRVVPWAHAWSAFVYLSNYFNAILGDPNTAFSHTWSLAIEEQFYLLWPVALLFLLRAPDRLMRRLLAALAGLWILRLTMVIGLGVPEGYVYAAFETRADSLLVGCLAAVAVENARLAGVLDRFVRRPWIVPLAIAVVISIALAEARFGPQFRNLVTFSLLPIIFTTLILHVTAEPSGHVTRILEWRAMRYVGRISYGMYLYQQVAVSPVRHLTSDLPIAVQLAVMFAVVIGLASVSYYVVERPFLALKDRFAAPAAGPQVGQLRQ